MPKITYVGPDEYGSVDPATGRSIRLRDGESAEVSDAKAEQVLRDFPEWFKVAKAPAASAAKGKAK